jgi:uncharacterized protein (TIGR02145 family)
MKKVLLLAFLCVSFTLNAQTLKDNDGNICTSVTIGKQTWMASNLNVTHFNNGDAIMQATTDEEWQKAANDHKPAWCYYKNDTTNSALYGKLYNYYAISDPRGISPIGWHIPLTTDFITMVKYLGGIDIAGLKIKSTTGWSQNGNGNNKSGFNAMPSGFRTEKGAFDGLKSKSQWWTSSVEEFEKKQVYVVQLLNYSTELMYLKMNKEIGVAVRCIKD